MSSIQSSIATGLSWAFSMAGGSWLVDTLAHQPPDKILQTAFSAASVAAVVGFSEKRKAPTPSLKAFNSEVLKLPDIRQMTGHRRRRGHGRAHQVGAAAAALTAFE